MYGPVFVHHKIYLPSKLCRSVDFANIWVEDWAVKIPFGPVFVDL